ncbi:MAG: FeoB-associated Cys-rich membrane protein [Clostridia bacterium]|nr:FeoB-associated Cys-rich membrane protein [Clostridia bacterium]
MKDIIIVAVLVVIIGLAAFYVYKAKKSGKKCIGCPDGGSCNCGCSSCPSEGGCCPEKPEEK